jgi:putative transposase
MPGGVIAVLSRLIQARGAPVYLHRENGPAFVADAIKAWISTSHSGPADIEPGKRRQNGAAEDFSAKFCDEWLNMEWFLSRKEVQVIIDSDRRQHNEVRPHSSLEYRAQPQSALASCCLLSPKRPSVSHYGPQAQHCQWSNNW